MKRYKSWILTDTAHDLWLENFVASNERMASPSPGVIKEWSIRKRTLHGGLRDGIDLIEVHNGELSFSILPTRGMGLWQGHFHGFFLGWKAPVEGPVHPKFVNVCERGGLGWLSGFDEWLCRCGLNFNGPPGLDEYVDRQGRSRRESLTLHGRIANQPAHYVEARVFLDPPYELSVIGQVEEGGLFAPRLHLTTTYTTAPGSNRLMIHDLVENRGAEPAEMQLLYHCNLGPPFLEAGSRLALPIREAAPINARAAEGIDTLDTYAGPHPGFAEQVYCFDPLADQNGRTLAMLYHDPSSGGEGKGVVLRFNTNELPCFTVWRNTAALEDGYVTGLEPATNFPNFKSFERKQGRVRVLPPAGRWECSWSIEALHTSRGVSGVLAEIASLQALARAQIHREPQPKFSAG